MRYALCGTAVAALLGATALAGPDKIRFPEGYRDSFTAYATVNRADERKQVVKIFANDKALESAKDGAPLDSGSVLVMEVYKAKLDAAGNPVVGSDGFFEPADMAAIAVMESREGWGAEYPEEMRNGTWEYALFDAKRGPKPVDESSPEDKLYSEIGKLKMQVDWLKKKLGE